jgi:hypothetical protein
MKRKIGRERATSVADSVNDIPLEEFVETDDLTPVSGGCIFENKSEEYRPSTRFITSAMRPMEI